jgi:hypothetical protein
MDRVTTTPPPPPPTSARCSLASSSKLLVLLVKRYIKDVASQTVKVWVDVVLYIRAAVLLANVSVA